MITVHLSDGSEEIFETVAEAEVGIEELVLGSDFAVTVESVEVGPIGDDTGELYCEWSVRLRELG